MRERDEVLTLYQSRKAERQVAFDGLTRQDVTVSNGRLATFILGIVLAWLAFHEQVLSAWWLLLPLMIFAVLIVRHDRLLKQKKRAERAVVFYESGLARMEGCWMGKGESGDRFFRTAHPYAADLDLFGSGSLFELLCTARTQSGEECLADWVCDSAEPATIRARQEAVRELSARLDLREELALRGAEVRSHLVPERITVWGETPIVLPESPAFGVALILGILGVGSLILWATGFGLLPLVIVSLFGGAFDAVFSKQMRQVVRAIDQPHKNLELFAELLEIFEQTPFESALLRSMQARLRTEEGIPPSARIVRLRLLVAYLEARSNMAFAPIAALSRWTFLFASLLERWREQNGKNLTVWLRTVGEFEALCALGAFAAEHSDSIFPEIVESGICYDAAEIAHPLLPASRAVRNSIAFDSQNRLYVVSGSNMSGKSTLLRTVGVNAILAFMGAPVLAVRFRIAPLSLAASIRTQDSLQAGVSRFYAEIQRLSQVVTVAREQPPCLFLLDEILHGTNSHDRLIGAEAILRALVREGAIGLVTTHDLALAHIVEDETLHATNVHFQDHMEAGQMQFDYHLRSGIVEKSNALELMRAVGLEIPLEEKK